MRSRVGVHGAGGTCALGAHLNRCSFPGLSVAAVVPEARGRGGLTLYTHFSPFATGLSLLLVEVNVPPRHPESLHCLYCKLWALR